MSRSVPVLGGALVLLLLILIGVLIGASQLTPIPPTAGAPSGHHDQAQGNRDINAERTPIAAVHEEPADSADAKQAEQPPSAAESWATATSGTEPGAQTQERGLMVDGLREGTWQVYHPSGRLWIEMQYKHGALNGLMTTWDVIGAKQSEDEYRDNKLDGAVIGWYSNGQQAYSYHYQSGLRQGSWSEWYESGHLKVEGVYVANRANGVCRYYNDDGTLNDLASGVYVAGKREHSLP